MYTSTHIHNLYRFTRDTHIYNLHIYIIYIELHATHIYHRANSLLSTAFDTMDFWLWPTSPHRPLPPPALRMHAGSLVLCVCVLTWVRTGHTHEHHTQTLRECVQFVLLSTWLASPVRMCVEFVCGVCECVQFVLISTSPRIYHPQHCVCMPARWFYACIHRVCECVKFASVSRSWVSGVRECVNFILLHPADFDYLQHCVCTLAR